MMDSTADTRPTLLLLPGLLCDEAVWAPQMAALQASHRCVVAEYGLADSLPAMAACALAQVGAQRFAVAGHSMGGRVAMALIRQVPERLTHLALLDTAWHPLPEGAAGEAERAGRLALLALGQAQGMRAMAAQWARGMVHPAQLDGPVFEAVVAMIARRTSAHQAAQIQALLNRPDTSALLRGWAGPTLLLCGEQDGWSPPARHREMQAFMPQASLVCVPDCGHMSTMEAPAAVCAALRAWLAG
jgi:pimeloyl-ACP methyl ester carboxylesterase